MLIHPSQREGRESWEKMMYRADCITYVSTTQGTRRIKDRKISRKTDYSSRALPYVRGDLTLQNCISGVTTPMENYASMILHYIYISCHRGAS